MEKIRYISILILIIASVFWAFNLVIGPVTSFYFAIVGFFLLLVDSIRRVIKGENKLETSILFFLVFVIIWFVYEIEVGSIRAEHILLFTFVPLASIYSILKLRGK
jgi:hypothetical protein